MEVTDRPQAQAECLDEKKSYKDRQKVPKNAWKSSSTLNISEHFPWVANCSWPAFVTKKRNEIWYFMFSEHRIGLSASLKKKLHSRECDFCKEIPEFWMLLVEVPALPGCPVSHLQHLHNDLITLPPTLPQLQTDDTLLHTESQYNDFAGAESHWPLQTGFRWSWPVGKAVYNQYQPAY